ncbi:MAG TPA: hypothetical protein VMA98_08600 [Candidatus Acidoferrales bacterium]|nr:hypothetical protein [Candidatus Acidoferrales bacterium]
MQILGTNFAITLGSWRLQFDFHIEDVDVPPQVAQPPPHHVRVVSEDAYSRREA